MIPCNTRKHKVADRELRRVHGDAGQPARALAPGCPGSERDVRQIVQSGDVGYKSSGRKPVRLATRANMRGSISSRS